MVTTEGGTPVTIRAFNFDQFKSDNQTKSNIPIWCRYVEDNEDAKQIGSPQVMKMESNTDMTCPSPKSDFTGNSRIEFSVNQAQWQPLKGKPIKFFNGPKVTSVSPNSGVTKNPKKLNLTIIGENFECPGNDCSRIKVRFTNDKGDEIFVDGFKNESNIVCKIPTYPAPETLFVDVSMNGVDFTNSKITYGYMDPFILKISP